MTIPYMQTYALYMLKYLNLGYNHKYETKF